MTQYSFLEPLDVLILRGNKLFGDPGSFGESVVPPWPSVAAGALRSRILSDDGVDLARFARGQWPHATLGTPQLPGTFTLTHFQLARRSAVGEVETMFATPADLAVEGSQVRRMTPLACKGVLSSSPLPQLPVFGRDNQSKMTSGRWLTTHGWRCYLNGEPLTDKHLVDSTALWIIEPRVGIGMSAATRSAQDSMLFTTQTVAFNSGVGFTVGVDGAAVPRTGTLRLGGDGRAAAIQPLDRFKPEEPPYRQIAAARRCRIVLTTPGIFPSGWRLPGLAASLDWHLGNVSGRVVAAAVPRAQVISGWNLAEQQPKPAERVAPAGSVYWLDNLDATPGALRELMSTGLWPATGSDAARRAEGFNRFTFAIY